MFSKQTHMKKWVKTKFLGRGSYGTVSLAVSSSIEDTADEFPLCCPVPSVIAVKSADFEQSYSLKREGKILSELGGCPEIVRCFGDDTSVEGAETKYNLLLEYAPGGSLADLINVRGGKFHEFEVSWYAYMLLMGLDHIHGEGFVHCDLKPDNILVFPSTKNGFTVNHLKIADFGLAKKSGSHSTAKKIGRLFRARGTPLYSSPESFLTGQNESPLDIWGLGCILLEMFTGLFPYQDFKDLEDLMEKIATDENLPEIPEFVSEKGRDFLKRCFIRDPKQRWSSTRLLNHPFIVDTPKKLLFQHRAQLVWDNPFGCTLWWSGKSSFSTLPPPPLKPVPLLPHQLFSKNGGAALCV